MKNYVAIFSSVANTIIIIIIDLVIELYFHGTRAQRYVRMTAWRFLGKVICLVLKLATHTKTMFVGLGQDVS